MISDEHLFGNIGIDSIGFHAPRHYVALKELALERKVDPEKYAKGLLSKEMRIADVDEDIISLGLKAGYNALQRGRISPKSVDALFVDITQFFHSRCIQRLRGWYSSNIKCNSFD
jgi:3-hydroxy-3-methylglutaryl CoA synthase